MTQKTIRFVGASRVNQAVLPFFFNRVISLTPTERRRALKYADEAKEMVRTYYRRADYPHTHVTGPDKDEVSPSALAAYAFFLRGIARGRVFRYGAIFHSVGVAAASLNHVDILQLLIREGIPLDVLHDHDYNGYTVLVAAIRYHHEDLTRALLEAFPRFATQPNANTEAMFACVLSGATSLFFEMVQRGFPLSCQAGFHCWWGSLLSAAVRRGRNTITRYLLKHAFTERNIVMPKDFAYDKNHRYFAWGLFEEAIDKQNREVLEHLKANGWNPPAHVIADLCSQAGLLTSLRCLKFAESVYPDLPFREHITSLRMDEAYRQKGERIDHKILRYYHLPPNAKSRRNPKKRDWRYDEPTSLYSLGECLNERPEAILRLIPKYRNLLRKYYKKRKFPLVENRAPSIYALCLAQLSETPLFTQEELQALIKKDNAFRYYSFRKHAKALGIHIPKEKPERYRDKPWRIAKLKGKDLQDFLDQSDEALEHYQEFYRIPMVRFIAEESTVDVLEMWMERGFPICACEDNESWHPTHYGNPEILEYYLTEVGMHYRTRAHMEGDTLAWAIRADEVECVKVFIRHGYPLNARKCNDDYPLTYAFVNGAEKSARVLYEAGAKMLDRKGRKMSLPPWFKP